MAQSSKPRRTARNASAGRRGIDGARETKELSTEVLKQMKLVTGYPPALVSLSVIRTTRHSGLDSRAIRSATQSSGRGKLTPLERATTGDANIHAQNFRERRPEATTRRNDTM